MEDCQAHNLKVVGSSPTPAINGRLLKWLYEDCLESSCREIYREFESLIFRNL